MDIVIPTIRNLNFLKHWRDFFINSHLIIIQDGDPNRKIRIPSGYSYEIYNHNDIKRELGKDNWIISEYDSACRCFGFLKAKSDYVLTIDDDVYPAKDNDGNIIDILKIHNDNLSSPSFPDYFNTLYDFEFVRGYPFERRRGKPTVISHGLWLGKPDLDAITALKNPRLLNKKYYDICITIPRNIFYPMSGMNLAFNRKKIGVSMYFGLMGRKYKLSRYDDMWAGWCSKKIADHLGYGIKSGKPYILHKKLSNNTENLKKEKYGIKWQNKIVSSFEDFKFSKNARSAESCYLELSDMVDEELSKIDPYFKDLANAMRIWVNIWNENIK